MWEIRAGRLEINKQTGMNPLRTLNGNVYADRYNTLWHAVLGKPSAMWWCDATALPGLFYSSYTSAMCQWFNCSIYFYPFVATFNTVEHPWNKSVPVRTQSSQVMNETGFKGKSANSDPSPVNVTIHNPGTLIKQEVEHKPSWITAL